MVVFDPGHYDFNEIVKGAIQEAGPDKINLNLTGNVLKWNTELHSYPVRCVTISHAQALYQAVRVVHPCGHKMPPELQSPAGADEEWQHQVEQIRLLPIRNLTMTLTDGDTVDNAKAVLLDGINCYNIKVSFHPLGFAVSTLIAGKDNLHGHLFVGEDEADVNRKIQHVQKILAAAAIPVAAMNKSMPCFEHFLSRSRISGSIQCISLDSTRDARCWIRCPLSLSGYPSAVCPLPFVFLSVCAQRISVYSVQCCRLCLCCAGCIQHCGSLIMRSPCTCTCACMHGFLRTSTPFRDHTPHRCELQDSRFPSGSSFARDLCIIHTPSHLSRLSRTFAHMRRFDES
jgi:hypothetical protein